MLRQPFLEPFPDRFPLVSSFPLPTGTSDIQRPVPPIEATEEPTSVVLPFEPNYVERSGAEIVRGAEGGDPSSVVFDAVQAAGARGADLVLADTAGRLHTKVNLVEELKKIRRVADREPGQVVEVLLVLDATTGQNAVSQAREFSEAVDATGVVLTKLDGTARGGVVVAISRELGLPVKLVGLGEGAADLVPFDPASFVDALLEP